RSRSVFVAIVARQAPTGVADRPGRAGLQIRVNYRHGRRRFPLPVVRFCGRKMIKVPMTIEGAARLRAELHRLKTIERPAVIQALSDARSHGDLSENADYDAAKDRQGFIEGRISEVEAKLAHAQVIDPAEIEADGRVVFGSTVEIADVESGERNAYQIVGDDEADIKASKISDDLVGVAFAAFD